MRFITVPIDSGLINCEKCQFLKYGRCMLFKKLYGESRSLECVKQDITDYVEEITEFDKAMKQYDSTEG